MGKKVKHRKHTKFNRDTRDYEQGRILTFARKFDAPRRALRSNVNRRTMEQKETSESDITTDNKQSGEDSTDPQAQPLVRSLFHEEFQLMRQSWQRGGRGKPPERKQQGRQEKRGGGYLKHKQGCGLTNTQQKRVK